MIYRNAIVLVTLAVSSNAFWWGSERDIEPQPTLKQVPVGYFRTFTYHPLAFNPQTPNQYYSYPGGKMLQPNSLYNYQKTLPAQPGLQTSIYGQIPSQHNVPNTENLRSPITPTNTVPVQTTQTSSHLSSSSQPSTYSASVNPTLSTTSSQSQPTVNEIQPPTSVPAQFSSNPHLVNNPPIRPFVPDPVNLQYVTNVSPIPLQHVQFVPCMCPVTFPFTSGMTPDVIANKRSDDIPIPPDYRDTSIGEQPLTEER